MGVRAPTPLAQDAPPSLMKNAVSAAIPARRASLASLKQHAGTPLDTITVGSVLGGMRGNRSMFWAGTTLSPTEGIKFHGLTIEQCQAQMPGPGMPGGEGLDSPPTFLPESMLWLLMTGSVPTSVETQSVTRLLNERIESQGGQLPRHVSRALASLPRDLHPMTQLAVGVALLQRDSQFARQYEAGTLSKAEYWAPTYDDSITLVANLPLLAGAVYSNVLGREAGAGAGAEAPPLGNWRPDRDWSYNLCSLLGMTADSQNRHDLTPCQQADFVELMRLYTGIHADHEGGNVSAHATHLVGSALADPFLSYAAGLTGLAGPLHGLAAQEVVRFLQAAPESVRESDSALHDYLWELLRGGHVVPGYGHAVLRRPDPRFSAMLRFAQERPHEFSGDPLVQLMVRLSHVAPGVLREHGKCQNPHPNVDAASGILFYHYGVRELLFFTVIFGCSRALGPLAQLVWDRAYGMPIERCKSIDEAGLRKLCSAV